LHSSSRADEKSNRQTARDRSGAHSRPKRDKGGPWGNITHVPSPTQGRPSPSSDQSKNNQPICRTNSFQNGGTENTSQPHTTRGLHGENRSRRRLSPHSNSPIEPKILSVPMGSTHLPVAVHAIRLPRCTTNIHKNNEGDRQGSTQSRHSVNSVHGRHTSTVQQSGTINQRSRPVTPIIKRIRFHDQPKEMRVDTNTNNGVPRCDSGLSLDDPIIIEGEDQSISSTSSHNASTSSERQTNSCSTIATTNWTPTISFRLRPTNSPSLQLLTRSTPISGATSNRYDFPTTTRDPRPRMVGEQPSKMEWETTNRTSNRSSVRHGCIGNGMGRGLLPGQGRLPTTPSRMPRILRRRIDQQYTGVDGSSEWNHVTNKGLTMVKLCSSSTNRQSSNHELHQSNGWSATTSSSNRRKNSQLLPKSQHSTIGGIPSRNREHNSRLVIPDSIGQFRIETAPKAVPAPGSALGTTYDRCSSIINQPPIRTIYQLPSRSELSLLRSVQSSHDDESKHLDEPTGIRSDPSQVHSQDSKREAGISYHDPTSMAQPTLVAPRVAPVPGLATTTTSSPSNINELGRWQTGRVTTQLAISRSAAIRQHLKDRGFSHEAITIWFNKNKGGEHGKTNTGHDKLWAKYETWVIARGGSPYNFEVSDIATYLTDVMIAGNNNASSRCKTFLSMCSTTCAVWYPDNLPLSTNQIIQGIRKGVEKTRSASASMKKKKQLNYYSLYKLFQYLETMTDNDATAPINIVRDKLIVLMLIDCMARASDLASITRESIIINENKLHFKFYFPKEEKSPGEVQSSIGSYSMNTKICSVTVMKHYLKRTSEMKIEKVDIISNDQLEKRTPLFIWQYKEDQKFYKKLNSERISKIGMEALHAIGAVEWKGHSIRGAASSKVVNLLPSLRPLVCIRARWANETTFIKSYFKNCDYKEANDPILRDRSIEFILRFKATKVEC
jgi:hypothetical protein